MRGGTSRSEQWYRCSAAQSRQLPRFRQVAIACLIGISLTRDNRSFLISDRVFPDLGRSKDKYNNAWMIRARTGRWELEVDLRRGEPGVEVSREPPTQLPTQGGIFRT
jgi:hypothetical protein